MDLNSMRLFTIGHSSRSLEEHIRLLQDQQIERLVDVRSFPTSRKHPHFNQPELASALAEVEIRYDHMQALGGFRRSILKDSPNRGWETPGFRAYADYMLTDMFQEALDRLVGMASSTRICIMCAEAQPFRCHRQLISDALLGLRGIQVFHILTEGLQEHCLTSFARIEKGRILYPNPQKSFLS